MKEILTSPAFLAFAGIVVLFIVGLIVKKTPTKKDDVAYANLLSIIKTVFNTAELIDAKGNISSLVNKYGANKKGVLKTKEALNLFKERFVENYDKMPDDNLLNFAKNEFEALALDDKLKKIAIKEATSFLKKKVTKKN